MGGPYATLPVLRRWVRNFARRWLDGIRPRVALMIHESVCCDSTTLSTTPKSFLHFGPAEHPSCLRLQMIRALRHHSLHLQQGMVNAKLSLGSGA